MAASMGADIRNEHPRIAEEYRAGMTAPQLVALYKFDRRYGVGASLAADAVRNAIRGYHGPFHPPYEGLIGDSAERERLALEHNRLSGLEEYQRRRGIHALTHDQKVEVGRKGGLIRGPLSYQLKIGCHALPPEVLREHCKRIARLGGKAGGVRAAVAKGQAPWAPATASRISELEFASRLAANPRYQGPVRANFRRIAEKTNEAYYGGKPHYTRVTLKIALQRYRRQRGMTDASVVASDLAFAYRLTLMPEYQLPARVKIMEIARRVNEEYHEGKPVRSATSIKASIRRQRFVPTAVGSA